jgi:hypothetical protein
MASYRLRVALPAPLLGCEYEIGCLGSPTFFYKHYEGDVDLAKSCGPFVYDVVNDHFDGKLGDHYRVMCGAASRITVASETMAETVKRWTGRDATIIDDPYENEEWAPQCQGQEVLWLGHTANIASLFDTAEEIADMPIVLTVLTNYQHPSTLAWSPETERRSLARCALMLVTGNNPGASANRIVKALRAGRFVVTPGGAPAWDEFKPYIWIGNVREGIKWALANREQACSMVTKGQEFVRAAFAPATIAARWMAVFDSILPQATSGKKDGSASISSTTTATPSIETRPTLSPT